VIHTGGEHDSPIIQRYPIVNCSSCICTGFFTDPDRVSRSYSREVRTLAAHTARLGQKGIAQDVTGLVKSATELVASINSLVKTASGIGLFLITLGVAMMGAAYWIIQQIPWTI
jgi:hypothetical protein